MRTQTAAGAAIAGQVGFVAAWVAGGLAEPGYSAADQTVSELFSRTAQHPWILWLGLAALVPSYLACALLLHRTLGRRASAAAGLFLLAVPLLITVLLAPLDCMTNGTAGCAARVAADAASSTHALHNAAAVTLQLVLVATPFATAVALRGTPRFGRVLAVGALGIVSVVAVGASGPGQEGYGIAQRATFGFVGLWVCAIAVAALRGQPPLAGSRSISSMR